MREQEEQGQVIGVLEIEAKARVENLEKIAETVRGLGGRYEKEEIQVDTYFNHPLKDFAETDEALRIRRVDNGCFITYKGPKLDDLTKTREEIEVKVEDFEGIKEILNRLGFLEVLTVEKRRRYFGLGGFTVMLDDVKDLGSFVEIEKLGEDYDPLEVVNFIKTLGINEGDIERRSYLGLILEKQSL
ncbi:MAG: class IV adenylate cyclase [Candidatus Hydrothermarchaeales archaeon]